MAESWAYSLVVELLLSVSEALGSVPSTKQNNSKDLRKK